MRGDILRKHICVGIVSFCIGMFAYVNNAPTYIDEVHVVTLSSGQTVEAVASEYYDQNEDGATYAEFREVVIVDNMDLFKNRVPQVGDRVVVTVKKKINE